MKNHLTLLLIVLFGTANSQVKSPCGNVKKKAEPKKYLNLYDQVSFDEEINTYVLTKDWYTPFNGTGQFATYQPRSISSPGSLKGAGFPTHQSPGKKTISTKIVGV